MASVIISCLSQKGGVGKSTLTRLIARSYAAAGWTVKICDFNTRQGSIMDWIAVRNRENVEPQIAAELYTQPTAMAREPYDLVVADGKPDSDQSSLEIARHSHVVVIPTGLTLDDLRPQVRFALELAEKGVAKERIVFVLNRTTDSEVALVEARNYLEANFGFRVARKDLLLRTGYQMAQNFGRAVSESKYPGLNDRAEEVAAEIVEVVNEFIRKAA
jgi:chromosome partitioning protein